MKRSVFAHFACASGLIFLSGCANYEADSPTVRLFRGEIHADEYRDAVAHTNERQRAQEAFETNRVPTRAYNTRTGRFEFVPQDTVQAWNPDTQRWEFTPPRDERDPVRDTARD